MIPFPIIILFITVLLLITRPITVLLHELGHAIPAILLTKKKVVVYIGSYGDPKNSFHFSLAHLEIWFKNNPFYWRTGLCISSAEDASVNKQIIYTLTGPLSSFLIAAVACYLTFSFNGHGFFRLFFVIFLISSMFDLFLNLVPDSKSIQLFDGQKVHNDGYQLKQLFLIKRISGIHLNAIELFNTGKYAEAAVASELILGWGFKHDEIYRLSIASLIQTKNYQRAKELTDTFFEQGDLDDNDYCTAAIIYFEMALYDKAIEFFDQSLLLNSQNIYTLNNKGYYLTKIEKFQEAIPVLNKAIEIDKDFAYSYNNRGLARIKIGDAEGGLEDINYSLKLDENNAYAYRNLGIYHLERGANEEAIALLKKAKSIDPTTPLVDELIIEAESFDKCMRK